MMKLFVTFGLLSLASAELRKWPSWLPKPPIGIPRLPPWLDFNLTPARKFNGGNYHIGQPCSVQYEKHVYKGTCQKDDDFSKSAFGGCPTDVSLYGCGAQRGDGNSMRCCVKVPCGKHWEKNNCMNKYKQPALYNAFHIDPNLCPFADDIACWVPELGQMESPTLYAAAPVGVLSTQDPTKDPNAPNYPLLLSTPSGIHSRSSPQIQSDGNLFIAPSDANSSPQIESDNTPTDPNSSLQQVGPNNLRSSSPSDPNISLQISFDNTPSSLLPSIRRRSRKARTLGSSL